MLREAVGGIALICDDHGRLLECRRDDIGSGAVANIGRPIAELLEPSSVERAAALFREVRERSAAFDRELLIRTADGDTVMVHVMAGRVAPDRVIIIGAASPAGVLGFLDELMEINNEQANLVRSMYESPRGRVDYDDFTRMNNELATTQRELVKANAALNRALQEKNRLIGMATHDLRNPLGVIRALSHLLLDSEMKLNTEQRRDMLSRITRSSEFMLALIDEMLELTTIEAGELRLELAPVDIGALVNDALEVERVLADEKDVVIHAHVAQLIPPVHVDARRIEQVLHNIVGNAIKFSQPGRPIDVTVSCSGSAGEDGRVRISVADRGPGIPAEEMDRLFRPFERTSVQASAGEPSTGLGLAIASRIVNAHRGRITCDTEVGVGTTFHIDLPIEP